MSFTEKIAGLMARPGQDAVPRDDIPVYIKYGGRILGIVGAFFAILFGLYNCLGVIFLNISCLISGIVQMLVGFLVMAIEAPCCCMFIDYVQQLAEKADQRPYWNRAALYCVIAIPPVILCPGLGSIFGCGLIFGTGVVYGMMSIGKKGTREDMAAVASPTAMSPGQGPTSTDQHTTLMEDPDVWRPTASVEEMRNAASVHSGLSPTTPTTNDRAIIITNAQPFSFTGAVATDSNV